MQHSPLHYKFMITPARFNGYTKTYYGNKS